MKAPLDRKQALKEVESNLKSFSQDYQWAFGPEYYMQHCRVISNPNSHLLERYTQRFGLAIKEPFYFSLKAVGLGEGSYIGFTNSIIIENWLNAPENATYLEAVNSHELAHALQGQFNERMTKSMRRLLAKRQHHHNPKMNLLTKNLGLTGYLLQQSESQSEEDQLMLYRMSAGAMLNVFLSTYNKNTNRWYTNWESLTEGFAEWASNKIIGKPNPKRADELQIFQRLEDRLGERKTLEIGLTAANDIELMSIVSQP
jgi:hypothetical protein